MIKFATWISRLEGTRYAKKARKIFIEDDMKGHYSWFSQVADTRKSNNLRGDNVSNNETKIRLTKNYYTSLLDRILDKTLDTGRKLRTYSKFKLTIKFEPYLDIISSANLKKLLAKFRLSSHDLEIETGRYESKLILPEQRICKIRDLSLVEDEFHFLMSQIFKFMK